MIVNIKMRGIKGQNNEQALTGKDIIIGRNGAGKTTRLQSMSLAAIGYVPGKGKTPADTFELASDDTMTVGIATDSFEVERTYKKSSKLMEDGGVDVKISQSINVSPSQGERTIKEKEQRIKEELGNFPAMLDFDAFVGLTDIKQRDFIYGLSGEQFTWDRERVETHLGKQVLREELYLKNPDMYKVMDKNFHDAMKQYSPKADVQSGLLAMAEHAKERLSYWKKEKNNSDAAARKLTELKNRATETDRMLAENEQKMKELEAEKEEIIKEIATATSKNQMRADRAKELEKLQGEIDNLQGGATEYSAEELKAKIDELYLQMNSINAKYGAKRHEAQYKDKEIEDIWRRLTTASEYEVKLRVEISEMKAFVEAESAILDKIHANAGRCALRPDIPCTNDFSGFIAETQSTIDDRYDKLDELKSKHDEAVKQEKTLSAEHKRAKAERSELQSEALNMEADQRKLSEEVKALEEALGNIENATPMLAAKTAEKARIEAWLEENPEVSLRDLEDRKFAQIAKIANLRETVEEQKKVRNDLINIKANIIDSETATFEQECWRQIAEAIGQKGVQGEIVKELLDPLRTSIDEKLKEMELPYNFYFRTENDRGKEVFEFGVEIYGNRRPFDALSQGEQMLLLIALMTTIIERKNPPVKILAIDNINHLDARNMNRVISGLNKVGGTMDNIILAGTPDIKEEDAPGWKVWTLE